MEDYKREFIEFLLKTNALKIGSNWTLKSGRVSPYFVNIGDFNTGTTTGVLGKAYAKAILEYGNYLKEVAALPIETDFNTVYGIPEKGVALAIATAIALGELGVDKPWFFTRKIVKEHGEASGMSKEEKRKAWIVGKAPNDGDRIVQLDDVFTSGDAKYQARKDLAELGDFKFPLLAIAVDRQEVGADGTSAIEKYEKDTGTAVTSIVNLTDIFEYLNSREGIDKKAVERLRTYARVYGTAAAKKDLSVLGSLEQHIINAEKSIIPACDVETIEQFENLVKATAGVPLIGGYKVGFELGLKYGLPRVVETTRKFTDKPIIYDHQKAGTDILETGLNFARTCKSSGVDAVILFPQAGPETERAWIYCALDHGLKVIVGGRMTHAAYAQSEGGFISDEGALQMYRLAAQIGVNNFVVPGNKPDVIKAVKEVVEEQGVKPTFYAPGFVAQGGVIADTTKVAGDSWHAIVGRGIYQAPDMKKAAEEHTSKL